MHKNKTHITLKKSRAGAPEKLVAMLLHEMASQAQVPILVAVGGPGGTGKSTFARALAAELDDAVVLRLDDYKTSRAFRADRNIYGPHPDANRIELLREHLERMKKGLAFDRPLYDRSTGEAYDVERMMPGKITVLDGEIATYRDFRDLVDLSIFIDSDWKTQLATRVERDIETRGYDREKAIATFLQSNLREFTEYGAESKQWADVHLYCDEGYLLTVESVEEGLYHRFPSIFKADYTEVALSGLIVPVLTPFKDTGEIDAPAFIQHLEFLSHHGIHRIMVNGTTAEFYSLLPEERKTLLKLARRYFPGMIISHVGGLGLLQNLEEVRWANELGADAVAALPPLYPAGLSADGIVEYLRQLSAAAEIPFILYNFPKHTGNALTDDMLQKIPHQAMKDSGQQLDLMPATPQYFIGSSSHILEPVQQGAAGFVAATANVRPELYSAFEMLLTDARIEEAARMQEEVRAYSSPFSAGGVPMLKQALARKLPDYPVHVRYPLLTDCTSS